MEREDVDKAIDRTLECFRSMELLNVKLENQHVKNITVR